MEKLRAKLKNQGGFTLIEMLIVVAIIAILVAVSMPVVSGAMDKTRHATDEANERAAKAEMVVQYLSDSEAVVWNGTALTQEKIKTDGTIYFYDAMNGYLTDKDHAPAAYGQCTNGNSTHSECYLALTIDENGQVKMKWTNSATVTVDNNDLCTGKAVDHN